MHLWGGGIFSPPQEKKFWRNTPCGAATEGNNEGNNCCLQMRFIGSKYARNAFAAGAAPRTPLGELIALPQTP